MGETGVPAIFEARSSKLRLILLLLACAGFIGACAYILLVPQALEGYRRSAWIIYAAAVLGLPFFAVGTVMLARMLFSTAVQVRVDGRGIYWSRWSDDPIPFSAIQDAWPFVIANQPMLCLALRDPGSYPAKSPVLRMSAKANRSMGAGDVAISMTGLDRSHSELMDAFSQWREAIAGRN